MSSFRAAATGHDRTCPQAEALTYFRPEAIGQPVGDPVPWIGHVRAADLDRDGLLDVLQTESKRSEVTWIRQVARGRFEEIVIGTDLRAPVHVEAFDLDRDGDLDVLVSSMSEVFPNNDRIGAIFVLENDGAQHFTRRLIIEGIARVTDAQAGDFNADGQIDLAVGQFGYDQARFAGWRTSARGSTRATSCSISRGPSTSSWPTSTATTPGHHRPHLQQWEEIYLFENNGSGFFTKKVIFGSTNEDYAAAASRCATSTATAGPTFSTPMAMVLARPRCRARAPGTACNGWRTWAAATSSTGASATCPAPTSRRGRPRSRW